MAVFRNSPVLWGVLVLLLSRVHLSASPTNIFFVSPGGDDSWSGRRASPNSSRTDGPLKSLNGAREAIRRARNQDLHGPIRIDVRGGTYFMSEPFVLEPQDSGTPDEPISYRAHGGEHPIFSGALRITNWTRAGSIWQASIPPSVKSFRQLFVGNSRATLARSPNEGYFRIAELMPGPMDPQSKKAVLRDRFRFAPEDLAGITNVSQLEVILMHSWENSIHPVRSINGDTRTIEFAPLKEWWSIGYWEDKQRYFLENAPELLDAPGEWFLDYHSARLSYIPRAGDNIQDFSALAPRLEQLVAIHGDPENRKLVEHIELRGLAFHHSDWALAPEGNSSTQAAVEVPAAIVVDGARNCRFIQCEVAHVGTYATWLRRGCQNNVIQQTRCFDLGAGGIRVGEARMARTDDLESSHNVVDNNLIFDGGRVYPGAVGIWVAQSSYNRISHNDIHDMLYSGLSIGWNWDDSTNRTHDNVIEWNHVHDIGRGVLSDEGLIYCLGSSPGSVIRNNIFHDIAPYAKPAFGWGIYLDATCSKYLVESNLVYNTRSGSIFWNNGGHEHTIRNNMFVDGQDNQIWPFWEKRPNTFSRNIVVFSHGNLFVPHSESSLRARLQAGDTLGVWDSNLYWLRGDPATPRFFNNTFEQWTNRTGLDARSIVADPMFTPGKDRFYRLRKDSPVRSLGFLPFTNESAGLYGDREWKQQVQHAHCR